MFDRTRPIALCFAAALALCAEVSANAVFSFTDGTAFDGSTGIGVSMTQTDAVSSVIVNMTTVDIIDWEGDLASEGGPDVPTLNIGGSGGLAVNSTPNTNWSNEATSINPGEGWVFKFDVDVNLVELDFASQGTDVVVVLSSPAFADKTLDYAHGDANNTHSLDDAFVEAGTEITLQFTSYIADDVLRLSSFTIEALATTNTTGTAIFNFVDGGEFDNPAAIGSSMTRSDITITTIDLIGQDGSLNSTGAAHRLNIYGSYNALGLNDAIDLLGIGTTELRDFNPGEGWVMSFDRNVHLVELDMFGQDAGAEMTVSSSAFSDFVLADGVNAEDIHSLANTFVAAGTEITFRMTSATNAADTGLSISSLTVVLATNQPAATETIHGTPYVWLDQFFQGLETEADYLNADESDSDGDSMLTWKEYLAGTIPTNSASLLEVNATELADTNCIVSWQSVTGKYYSVMVETNLVAFSNGWKTVANNIQGLETETAYTTTVASASAAFYKVGIEKRAIYLLIGQSNMAGRAPIETQDEAPVVGCELFNSSNGWETATNPLNRYSTIRKDISLQNLGPGYGFAQRMREVQPEIHLGLVVNARGGTSISEWEKGTTYYNEAISRVQSALKDGNSRLAGILWHQGEGNSSQTTSYLNSLAQLVADFRADLGDPDLPFVAGQLEQDDVTPEVKERPVNDYIILLPTVSSNTAVATTEGLLTMDGTHFDSAGQRELGRRYAEALLSLE
ncbi:Carbohydrate acetyl esterase/feruloyl esterase [Pontiella desulfatans]|uniref:Carbohydrate acetyl esterase/feruloyl esterase n=1 Tax=Pontiella desulfatans TaxID=2750659 RepID=A0A6C2TWQ3_PONDE|nr:sialate O-acetylesterase [Pontiella desulfatans]VGO11751.1 Carbohydrate acetyl esterase/feruloyl esterase [Pontiella desulfatans]